ncbi:MAG: L-threonylcarbamoyladenylate synthase [Holophagae bacterium]|jgi:tRNA threonylcarbamoyl adenosine modification protein (Sua5/YciO/YrdC/YwlC family)
MIRLPFVESGDVIEAVHSGSAIVSAGGVLLLPTESFYGLGADPRSEAGVARIFSMKDRPFELGLPVLCADWQQLESLVVVPARFRTKLSRLWPAALTVVLPTVNDVPAAQAGTLAVRIPAHPELRALLYGVGPLTGTSANRHGDPPFTTVDGALGSLAEAPDLALDSGATAGGEVSTLVDLSGSEPDILRSGACSWEEAYPDRC